MKRRDALKTLALVSGGLVALPAWAAGWKPGQLDLPSSIFSSSEELLITSVADTIIPGGDSGSAGALSVGVDRFLIRLFEECYDRDVQENIANQLRSLNSLALEEAGAEFTDCSRQERERLLLSFGESEDENRSGFFSLVKSETIRGFSTSQVVMEQYLDYNMIPGYYDGCVDVNI